MVPDSLSYKKAGLQKMKTLSFYAAYIIPAAVLIIILGGILKKINVFDVFCKGAFEGLKTSVSIIAPICALTVSIYAMRSSGLLGALSQLIRPVTSFIGLDENLLPLALLRPISGSGSLGIVTDIVSQFGGDSFIARTACVMAGSTETTFYTLALYFGASHVKNTRHAVQAALMADITSLAVSLAVCKIFFL